MFFVCFLFIILVYELNILFKKRIFLRADYFRFGVDYFGLGPDYFRFGSDYFGLGAYYFGLEAY